MLIVVMDVLYCAGCPTSILLCRLQSNSLQLWLKETKTLQVVAGRDTYYSMTGVVLSLSTLGQ